MCPADEWYLKIRNGFDSGIVIGRRRKHAADDVTAVIRRTIGCKSAECCPSETTKQSSVGIKHCDVRDRGTSCRYWRKTKTASKSSSQNG
jgi:hypothetical protein